MLYKSPSSLSYHSPFWKFLSRFLTCNKFFSTFLFFFPFFAIFLFLFFSESVLLSCLYFLFFTILSLFLCLSLNFIFFSLSLSLYLSLSVRIFACSSFPNPVSYQTKCVRLSLRTSVDNDMACTAQHTKEQNNHQNKLFWKKTIHLKLFSLSFVRSRS